MPWLFPARLAIVGGRTFIVFGYEKVESGRRAPPQQGGVHQLSRSPRKNVRRRPTLPHPPECSTIGAVELSYRVRNGTGRFPDAMTAVTRRDQPAHHHTPTQGCIPGIVSPEPHSRREHTNKQQDFMLNKSSAISTSQLHTSQCFHIWPINPVIYWGPLTQSARISHLEAGFPLRCFQRLSLPNVANQPCPWQNNWHTRGQSIPVLSY